MEDKQKDFISNFLNRGADQLIQAKEAIEAAGNEWPSNKAYLEGIKEDIKHRLISFIGGL